MKYFPFRFMVMMTLLGAALLVFPAAAQEIDLSDSFTFESGTTFSFPEGGEITVDEDAPAFMSVAFANTLVYVADFPVFEERDFSADSDLIDAAEWYIETISDVAFDADAAETIDLDGREALTYPYIYEGDDWLLVMIRLEDGSFVAFDAGGTDEVTLRAIAASLGTAEAATNSGSSTDCTISAAAEGTVQLRVGPGENRTSFAFLPANIEFTPLGQAEANDGSEWFQLDRAEVAPRSAAAEAWVAADTVETSGDCANVGAASAPPIVPIIPAAPPSSSGGGDNGSGSSSNSGGSGGIAPAPGTWTITYARQGKGSCLDNAGFTYDFNVDWGSDVVSLSLNGSYMILGGNRFTQIQPGVFSGVFTLQNGNSLQLILRPVTASHLTGEALLTGVIDGHTCSNTVPVTVTKN